MKKLLAAILISGMSTAHAAFMIDTMTGFSSSTDSKTTTNVSDMSNHIFIGASLGQKQRFFVGQNITIFSHSVKQSQEDKINTLELGPRMTYFFTDENVFYFTLGWNPYAKGKRTIAGVSEDISGYALLAGIGAELKINRVFHIGGSLNYHNLNVTESVDAAKVATSRSDKYNSLMPMINLSLRFR